MADVPLLSAQQTNNKNTPTKQSPPTGKAIASTTEGEPQGQRGENGLEPVTNATTEAASRADKPCKGELELSKDKQEAHNYIAAVMIETKSMASNTTATVNPNIAKGKGKEREVLPAPVKLPVRPAVVVQNAREVIGKRKRGVHDQTEEAHAGEPEELAEREIKRARLADDNKTVNLNETTGKPQPAPAPQAETRPPHVAFPVSEMSNDEKLAHYHLITKIHEVEAYERSAMERIAALDREQKELRKKIAERDNLRLTVAAIEQIQLLRKQEKEREAARVTWGDSRASGSGSGSGSRSGHTS